ncbi:helix-turn-helix transcriptional regulator [Actinoalloteichus caeruleus]|uniref:helix-turn-helix transcriptional regulator n=1 Tax=Actinoalloteichus cyanogriseus TaxID=2893586 RepID=UPI003BB85B28
MCCPASSCDLPACSRSRFKARPSCRRSTVGRALTTDRPPSAPGTSQCLVCTVSLPNGRVHPVRVVTSGQVAPYLRGLALGRRGLMAIDRRTLLRRTDDGRPPAAPSLVRLGSGVKATDLIHGSGGQVEGESSGAVPVVARGSNDRVMARTPRPLLGSRRVVVGFTQEALAEALGVDRTTVSRWERGAHVPNPGQRPHLARVLGVTMERLDHLLLPNAVTCDVPPCGHGAR